MQSTLTFRLARRAARARRAACPPAQLAEISGRRRVPARGLWAAIGPATTPGEPLVRAGLPAHGPPSRCGSSAGRPGQGTSIHGPRRGRPGAPGGRGGAPWSSQEFVRRRRPRWSAPLVHEARGARRLRRGSRSPHRERGGRGNATRRATRTRPPGPADAPLPRAGGTAAERGDRGPAAGPGEGAPGAAPAGRGGGGATGGARLPGGHPGPRRPQAAPEEGSVPGAIANRAETCWSGGWTRRARGASRRSPATTRRSWSCARRATRRASRPPRSGSWGCSAPPDVVGGFRAWRAGGACPAEAVSPARSGPGPGHADRLRPQVGNAAAAAHQRHDPGAARRSGW